VRNGWWSQGNGESEILSGPGPVMKPRKIEGGQKLSPKACFIYKQLHSTIGIKQIPTLFSINPDG